MKVTLQTKLLLLCIFLILFTAIGISLTYYRLTRQDKQQESQQRIQIAFEIVLRDLQKRIDTYNAKFQEFIEGNVTLLQAAYAYSRDDSEAGTITFLFDHFAPVSEQLKFFGRVTLTDHLLLYGVNKRLLVAYQRVNNEEKLGSYIIDATGGTTYLDMDDLYTTTEITFRKSNLSLGTKDKPFPMLPLPEGILATYEGDLPEKLTTEVFTEGSRIGVRITAPLYRRDQVIAIIVGEVFYQQQMIEEYAELSNAKINVFAGKTLSVGTLQEQTQLEPDIMESAQICDIIFQQETEDMTLTSWRVNQTEYYQGICRFEKDGKSVGAVTVNLSKEVELAGIRRIASAVVWVSSITVLIGILLTVAFSRKSMRFIQQLITTINRLSKGEIPAKLTEKQRGELLEIQHNMNLLIDATLETARLAEEVAEGNLQVEGKERSPQDRLMKALNAMIRRLNRFSGEMDGVAQAVQEGKLSVRAKPDYFSGGWLQLVIGMNNLIDAFVAPISMTAEYLDRIGKGDLPEPITREYHGDFNQIKHNVNLLIGNMRQVLAELGSVIQAIHDGRLQVRGNDEPFAGDWRRLVSGINGVLDAFLEPITVTAACMNRIAKGDVPEKIPMTYRGDFAEMIENMNTLIDSTYAITQLAEEMAQGNLTVEVKERSERDLLMRALNAMLSRLSDVVVSVKIAAETVADGSRDMRKNAEAMSQGAALQAASAEEVSSSMEQMAANIRQNADNAKQTEALALQSAEYAEQSGKVVSDAVNAMEQIARKIMIIEEIAMQTRLLSLNATIEAARAQEHGKAFSVVAAEVRKLSDVTRKAAEEINELATSTVQVSKQAGEMLMTLLPSIHRTTELVQEISAASYEQNSGAEQVNNAIQQLDQVIQRNAATAESFASMSEELDGQAVQLRETMEFFAIKSGRHLKSDENRQEERNEYPILQAVRRPRSERTPYRALVQPNQVATQQFLDDLTLRPQKPTRDERDDEFERY